MLDRDPVDVVCDLLVDEALEVSYVSAGDGGRHTGVLAGRALRRGRAST
jgi:hypothetical protein